MFHSVLLTFSLLLTGGFVPLEAGLQTLAADDLQGLIRKFESERGGEVSGPELGPLCAQIPNTVLFRAGSNLLRR